MATLSIPQVLPAEPSAPKRNRFTDWLTRKRIERAMSRDVILHDISKLCEEWQNAGGDWGDFAEMAGWPDE